MVFQRENQRVSATDILEAIARGDEINLKKCTVTGEVDINRLFVRDEDFDISKLDHRTEKDQMIITLFEPISIIECVFENDVFFAPPWDKPREKVIDFQSKVAFNSSVFMAQTRFSGAIFRENGSFDGCVFQRIACFRNTTFKKQAMFRTVTFDGYGLFTDALFCHEARFNNTCFSKGGNFTNVTFEEKSDFAGVYSRSKSVPIYESVKFKYRQYGYDETFWRFIKQASQEAGYYQQAGESFYNERCAHFWRKFRGPNYSELSGLRRLGRWIAGIRLAPEFIFGRLLFGYGERPTRVLIASLLIIFTCALFYSYGPAKVLYRSDTEIHDLTLMDGLYFSTITFTTLGFGDIYPYHESTLTRTVAMFESISGACLMALFVVCLSKRYSRG